MMTLVFVGGVLLGLAWGAVERHRLRRECREWREKHAAVWRAGAESLARCRRPERDRRDTVDTDAQEGD